VAVGVLEHAQQVPRLDLDIISPATDTRTGKEQINTEKGEEKKMEKGEQVNNEYRAIMKRQGRQGKGKEKRDIRKKTRNVGQEE
jgi:hypothetical protein